jgi:hypothetical protein
MYLVCWLSYCCDFYFIHNLSLDWNEDFKFCTSFSIQVSLVGIVCLVYGLMKTKVQKYSYIRRVGERDRNAHARQTFCSVSVYFYSCSCCSLSQLLIFQIVIFKLWGWMKFQVSSLMSVFPLQCASRCSSAGPRSRSWATGLWNCSSWLHLPGQWVQPVYAVYVQLCA